VRFNPNIKYTDPKTGFSILLRSIRYLYFDNLAVGSYQLGVSTATRHKVRLSAEQTQSFVDYFFKIPVAIPRIGKELTARKVKLINSAPSIAELFYIGTTSTGHYQEKSNRLVKNGFPLIIMEYDFDKMHHVILPESFCPKRIRMPAE
jgi:hypothetical protein